MTFFDELILAARGVVALILARRNAPDHFQFTPRGLAGSFIAYFAILLMGILLPDMSGGQEGQAQPVLSVTQLVFLQLIVTGLTIACVSLFLRQIGRLDGLLAYLVVDNWSTFFGTGGILLLSFAGPPSFGFMALLGLFVIYLTIQVGRLVLTLSPMQIVGYILAQFVGVALGFLVTGLFAPTA